MTQTKLSPKLPLPSGSDSVSQCPGRGAVENDPLTPAQRNFAQVLGRFLALQWEREQQAASRKDDQAPYDELVVP
jgi:hypothetical protein